MTTGEGTERTRSTDETSQHCGYTTGYVDPDGVFRKFKCDRPIWEHDGNDAGCVWHAKIPKKPRSVLRNNLEVGEESDRIQLIGAYLSGARLSRTDLSEAYLSRTDLSGAYLLGTDFSKSYLLKTNLIGANLLRANLSGANLYRADLSGANLSRANLSGANLRNATLTGANLAGADLSEADLTSAVCIGSNFEEATLRETNISDADLRYILADHTNFLFVRLTGETKLGSESDKYKNSYEHLADWLAEQNLNHSDGANHSEGWNVDYHETLKMILQLPTELEERSVESESNSRHMPSNSTEILEQSAVGKERNSASVKSEWSLPADKLPKAWYHISRWNTGIRRFRQRPLIGIENVDFKKNPNTPEVDLLRRANRVYENYQRMLRENGMGDKAASYFIRRKHVQRKLARAEERNVDWIELAAERWLLGHGEKPWHVLGLATLFVLLSTLVYAILGVTTVGGRSYSWNPSFSWPTEETALAFLWSFLLSVSTFLLAGDASGVEVSVEYELIGRLVTTTEALAGAVLLALFFFSLGRIVTR